MKESKATEARRVATDIAAIKAALHKRGYRLRKRPKQPVWRIIITPDRFYTLTYQPAQSVPGYSTRKTTTSDAKPLKPSFKAP